MGCSVCLITTHFETIAQMSCNPAVGGLCGHLVREIDALGGLMGLLADATGIHFRLLNRSRGAAVQPPVSSATNPATGEAMKEQLEKIPGEPLSGDRRRAGYRRVPDSRRRLRRRPVDRGRGRHPHARHVPQRTHPCRAGLLSRRPGQRASIRRAGGRGSEGGIENIPLEDGDADAAGREDDRLVGFRGSARRRRTGPDVAEDGDGSKTKSSVISVIPTRRLMP